MSGREDGAAPTPSAKPASSRTEPSQARGVGQPRAGCSAHRVAQLKDSQALRSSDQAPTCILRMLRLCIPTQGQGAVSAQPLSHLLPSQLQLREEQMLDLKLAY